MVYKNFQCLKVKIAEKIKKSDFFIPLEVIGKCKFDLFIGFLSSIIFGQVGILITCFLSFIFWSNEYLVSSVMNGDLLMVSMAFLGTYFGIIILEVRENNDIYLREVKMWILVLDVLVAIFSLIILGIIKGNSSVASELRIIVVQVIIFILSTFLSVYSLLVINCDKYIEREEEQNNSDAYLYDEENSINDIRSRANQERTSEGDEI